MNAVNEIQPTQAALCSRTERPEYLQEYIPLWPRA
jgi:hypothetical protein